MRYGKFFFVLLLGGFSSLPASADLTHAKLSPSLGLLQAVRQSNSENAPPFITSVAFSPEIKVSVRFSSPIDPEIWVRRGLRLRSRNGTYSGSGTVYGARMTWEEIEHWSQDPEILQIASEWHPRILPCLDLSAPEVGAAEVWEIPDPGGNPITGAGILIADFDTGVDVFHPMFFRPMDSLRYNWLDVDQNGEFTPGVDAVDLDGSGSANWDEILDFIDGQIYDPAMTFGGNGVSNADGIYQADWDWLYNDPNGNGQRDYGVQAGYSENDPGYGEMLFYVDDTDGDLRLDVGEQLIPLGQSKILAVMEQDSVVRHRGVDLITAQPDSIGHGTAVCGILAAGQPGISRFTGLAPGADLLMGYYFDGVSFFEYLPWVREMGGKVLLYEFGGFIFFPLDGSTNEELLLDSEAGQGVLQVTPAGNLNRGYKHCQLQIESGEDVPIRIGAAEYGGEMPAWAGITFLWREPEIELGVTLEDPYGYTLELDGNGGIQSFASWQVYSGFWVSPRGTAEYDISLWGSGWEWIIGTWTVTLHHPGGEAFDVNGYVQDDVSAWEGGAEFLDYRSNDKTVTWPATADSAFVLGSYSTRGYEGYSGVGSGSILPGDISLFSGRGTRIDGMHILSLTAPGNYDVYSTRSEWGYPFTHAGYRQFSGTSAAGPHVAAAAALVLQADTSLSRAEVENYLETYALQDEFTGSGYNDTWGYGKLRVADLIRYLGVSPSLSSSGLPTNIKLRAFPNPSNSTINLLLDLPDRRAISIVVFDLAGREIAHIHEGVTGPGVQRFTWNPEGVSSGIYLVKAGSTRGSVMRKVVLLK